MLLVSKRATSSVSSGNRVWIELGSPASPGTTVCSGGGDTAPPSSTCSGGVAIGSIGDLPPGDGLGESGVRGTGGRGVPRGLGLKLQGKHLRISTVVLSEATKSWF